MRALRRLAIEILLLLFLIAVIALARIIVTRPPAPGILIPVGSVL